MGKILHTPKTGVFSDALKEQQIVRLDADLAWKTARNEIDADHEIEQQNGQNASDKTKGQNASDKTKGRRASIKIKAYRYQLFITILI